MEPACLGGGPLGTRAPKPSRFRRRPRTRSPPTPRPPLSQAFAPPQPRRPTMGAPGHCSPCAIHAAGGAAGQAPHGAVGGGVLTVAPGLLVVGGSPGVFSGHLPLPAVLGSEIFDCNIGRAGQPPAVRGAASPAPVERSRHSCAPSSGATALHAAVAGGLCSACSTRASSGAPGNASHGNVAGGVRATASALLAVDRGLGVPYGNVRLCAVCDGCFFDGLAGRAGKAAAVRGTPSPSSRKSSGCSRGTSRGATVPPGGAARRRLEPPCRPSGASDDRPTRRGSSADRAAGRTQQGKTGKGGALPSPRAPACATAGVTQGVTARPKGGRRGRADPPRGDGPSPAASRRRPPRGPQTAAAAAPTHADRARGGGRCATHAKVGSFKDRPKRRTFSVVLWARLCGAAQFLVPTVALHHCRRCAPSISTNLCRCCCCVIPLSSRRPPDGDLERSPCLASLGVSRWCCSQQVEEAGRKLFSQAVLVPALARLTRQGVGG